jgi:hypothetical protein
MTIRIGEKMGKMAGLETSPGLRVREAASQFPTVAPGAAAALAEFALSPSEAQKASGTDDGN